MELYRSGAPYVFVERAPLHVDFMVGSSELAVDGVLPDGERAAGLRLLPTLAARGMMVLTLSGTKVDVK